MQCQYQQRAIHHSEARDFGCRADDNKAIFVHQTTKEKNMPSRRELANAIRALSMDAVQKANSGHPGAQGLRIHARCRLALTCTPRAIRCGYWLP